MYIHGKGNTKVTNYARKKEIFAVLKSAIGQENWSLMHVCKKYLIHLRLLSTTRVLFSQIFIAIPMLFQAALLTFIGVPMYAIYFSLCTNRATKTFVTLIGAIL